MRRLDMRRHVVAPIRLIGRDDRQMIGQGGDEPLDAFAERLDQGVIADKLFILVEAKQEGLVEGRELAQRLQALEDIIH